MKTILLLLFACGSLFAQDFITKTDGTRIDVVEGSIKMEHGNKKLQYATANGPVAKIKVKDLASASYKDHQIKTFIINGKRRAYYILANSNGKQLVSASSVRVASKGGFDVPYKRFEVAMISGDNIIFHSVFTDVNSEKNRALRQKAFESIVMNMSDCPNIVSRLQTFDSPESGGITKFLDDPYVISCN